jgi:hypothetical protein
MAEESRRVGWGKGGEGQEKYKKGEKVEKFVRKWKKVEKFCYLCGCV